MMYEETESIKIHGPLHITQIAVKSGDVGKLTNFFWSYVTISLFRLAV